jgi:hypothetical protein
VTKASVRPNRRVLSRESTRESGLDRTLQFVAKRKPAPPRADALQVLARMRRVS